MPALRRRTGLVERTPLGGAAGGGGRGFLHETPCTRYSASRPQFSIQQLGHLIIGSVPAVLVGSLVSSSAPDHYIRPLITFVIAASGLKYVGVGTTALGWILCGVLLAAAAIWLTYLRPRQQRASEMELAIAAADLVPVEPGESNRRPPPGDESLTRRASA